jgi:hypothetical protein
MWFNLVEEDEIELEEQFKLEESDSEMYIRDEENSRTVAILDNEGMRLQYSIGHYSREETVRLVYHIDKAFRKHMDKRILLTEELDQAITAIEDRVDMLEEELGEGEGE